MKRIYRNLWKDDDPRNLYAYGMEIVAHNLKARKDDPEAQSWYSFQIGSWWDLTWFFVRSEYSRELLGALGWVRFLYVGVWHDNANGTFYYSLLPYGIWIALGRMIRWVWFLPAKIVDRAGILDVPRGARLGMFWVRYVRFWPRSRK